MNHEVIETQAYAQHLLDEHRRLHEAVRRVEGRWPSTRTGLRGGDVAKLVSGLESLRDELADHFGEEESGGVMEEAVSRRPDLGREVARLMDEHVRLLSDLDRIIRQLREVGDAEIPLAGLTEDYQRLVRKLHEHETAENRILEQGFNMEII